MKEICLDLSSARGIGDTICSTPVIRKLYSAYQKPIPIITLYPEVFNNNPYVKEVFPTDYDRNELEKRFDIVSSFNVNEANQRGIVLKHNLMDIRQFHASTLGFSLSPDEMSVDFFPDPYEGIENLPDKFVLIHPTQNWASRTWSAQNWMNLVQVLNDEGIPVVSIGKDSSEIGFFNTQKPVFNFEIPLGLNLLNKTTLSQSWWLMSKCLCFITMDSGMLHLAGTSSCHIIQLGSSIKKELRAPYRNGTQDFKYNYVSGSCDIACASDMKYGIKEWKTFNAVPPLVGCLENKPTFECHPKVETVFDTILKIIPKKDSTPINKTISNPIVKKPKIKLVHLLLRDDMDSNRQTESIKSISLLKDYGIEYIQCWNWRWTSMPDLETWSSYVYLNLTHIKPSYYGCYKAFKDGTLNHFQENDDIFIICEGDAYLIDNLDEVVNKIYRAYDFCIENDIPYFNFGSKYNLRTGGLESQTKEEIGEFSIVDKCIGAQMVMFTNKYREYIIEQFNISPWNVGDIFFNEIFMFTHKIAMYNNPVCLQWDGHSSINDGFIKHVITKDNL